MPDFDYQINAIFASGTSKEIDMINWQQAIYRWPSLSSNEANRLTLQDAR